MSSPNELAVSDYCLSSLVRHDPPVATTPPEQAPFSENLKRFRVARGMTQDALADAIKQLGDDVKANTLSKYERGTLPPPPADRLRLIARALGVSTSDLLGEASPTESYVDTSTAQSEAHSVVEEFLREHPDLEDDVVAELRTVYWRGANDQVVRDGLAGTLASILRGRARKVEEKGQKVETVPREGARRLAKK